MSGTQMGSGDTTAQTCPNGHPAAGGSRFCTQCGAQIGESRGTGGALATGSVFGTVGYVAPPPVSPPSGSYGSGYGYGYGYGMAYGAPASSGTNGMAITSLILGILWMWGLGSILALVFGYVGKRQIDQSGRTQGGRGMAMAGIVLGWIGVAGAVLLTVFIIVAAHSVSSAGSYGDGYRYGFDIQGTPNSAGDATTDCSSASVPFGDISITFYDGCIAGWTSSSNAG